MFQNVLQTSLQGKTRILVTHALHFLPYVDYIFVMLDGNIVERGSYPELMGNNGEFAKFIREFGNNDEEVGESAKAELPVAAAADEKKPRGGLPGAQLMQAEERNTGAVSGKVYGAYFSAGNGHIVIPILLLCLVMMQGCTVMSSYW